MKRYLSLIFTMLKIGLFTFGGGYAMLALLQNEFVEKKGYLQKDEFLDMVAIAESTPGPIAINAATYIGFKQLGFFGALFATLSVSLPSFIIIYLISLFFDAFLSIAIVFAAFRGIQAGVIFLIASTGIKMLRQLKKTPLSLLIFSLTFLASIMLSLFSINFSAIFYILIAGLLGVFAFFLCKLSGEV